MHTFIHIHSFIHTYIHTYIHTRIPGEQFESALCISHLVGAEYSDEQVKPFHEHRTEQRPRSYGFPCQMRSTADGNLLLCPTKRQICVCLCMYVCMYVCVYVSMYVCMYVYTVCVRMH